MTAIDGLASRSLEGTLGALRRAAQGGFRRAAAATARLDVSEAEASDWAADEAEATGVSPLRAERVRDTGVSKPMTAEEYRRLAARQLVLSRYF